MTFRLEKLIGKLTRRKSTRALEHVLEAGRVLVNPEADETLAAYWALRPEEKREGANQAFGLALAQRRYLERLKRDRVRLEQAVEATRKLAVSEDAKVLRDPLQHFLELSGCDPADIPALYALTEREATSSDRPVSRFRIDRPSRVLKRAASGALLASLVLYVVTLGLNASDPLIKRVLNESQSQAVSWYMLGQTSRGAEAAWQREVSAGYLEAFSLLNDSRTSILGQFPGYDRGRLTIATKKMADVVAMQRQREPASSRVLILLAGLYITLDRKDEARPILENVVRRNDDEAERAQALLDATRASSRTEGYPP